MAISHSSRVDVALDYALGTVGLIVGVALGEKVGGAVGSLLGSNEVHHHVVCIFSTDRLDSQSVCYCFCKRLTICIILLKQP